MIPTRCSTNLPAQHFSRQGDVMTMSGTRLGVAVLSLLLAASTSAADGHVLKPVAKIGVGWDANKPAWMSFVAFSLDGKMVASDGPATKDDVSGNLTLWTFPGGRLVKRLEARPLVMSADWQFYASERGVRRISDDAPITSTRGKHFSSYAFSQDGRYVAEARPKRSETGGPIAIVELSSGKLIGSFGSASPLSIAISPNGRILAAGYWDIVVLWSTATHKRLATLRGFGRYVDSLSFSANGRFLAGGTDIGTLQIWDVRHKARIHALDVGGEFVSQPAFSPDGSLVAVGIYGTGAVWLFDVRSGKVLDHRKVSDIGCGSVAFSPDGRYLITPSTGGLISWPHDEGGTIRVFRVLRGDVHTEPAARQSTGDHG